MDNPIDKNRRYQENLNYYKSNLDIVPEFDEHVLFSLERKYLDIVDIEKLELATDITENDYDHRLNLRIVKIDEVTHRGKENYGLHLMNIQNSLCALKDPSHSLISIIKGTKEGTSLYYGLSKKMGRDAIISTEEYSKILMQTMHGNFLGTKFKPLDYKETLDHVIKPILDHRDVFAFPGIPSLRLKNTDGFFAQGIDRFVEGMRNEEYMLVTIAEPIDLMLVDSMISNLFDLGSSVHTFVKSNITRGKSTSDTLNIGYFGMKGTSNTYSESTTTSSSDSEGESKVGEGGAIKGVLGGLGTIVGSFFGPVGTIIGGAIGSGLGDVVAYCTDTAVSTSTGKSTSFAKTIANSVSNSFGSGFNLGYSRSWSRNTAISVEQLNKKAEYTEKLCDKYIERLQSGKNLGFWNVGIYLISKHKYTQLRGKGLLTSVLSGDNTYWEPIRSIKLNPEATEKYIYNFNNPKYNLFSYGQEEKELLKHISLGEKIKKMAGGSAEKIKSFFEKFGLLSSQEQVKIIGDIEKISLDMPEAEMKKKLNEAFEYIKKAGIGHPLGEVMGGVSTPLNTEELSIIMNVPRFEVKGISIRESAEFGSNYTPSGPPDRQLEIGKIIHKGEVRENEPFTFDKNSLTKHGFICGVTGSGKTNTSFNLLLNSKAPFLVIEPAKTEYRKLLSVVKDLKIFTLGNENVSPFRINPFEFVKGVELTTHIDYLKAVFNAAFPMYASMPYILEDAIYQIYLDKGWELSSSTNKFFDIDKVDDFHDYFPTLSELFEKVGEVVKTKQYGEQLTMDLSGALNARLSSLLTGSKGAMLNTRISTPIGELLKNKVVLELSSMGDDEEKAFLMGLIFARIYEYREANHDGVRDLKHITVIEEAHRLLKNVPEVSAQDSANVKGKAVETFSNFISEIREYGEGIIIIDQIPAKMTQDVIKNTNFKIVHRLLAKDDRDQVGDAMNLNDGQKRELPILKVGETIVYRDGLDKAFLVKISEIKDQLKPINKSDIFQSMDSFHKDHNEIYMLYPGFEKSENIPQAFKKMDFRRFDDTIYSNVISFVAALITCNIEQVNFAKKKVLNSITEILKYSDETDLNCCYIWYLNKFFSSLKELYSAKYDKCLKAHYAIAGIWFEKNIDIDKSKEMNSLFAEMVDNDDIYEPISKWMIINSKSMEKLEEILSNQEYDKNDILNNVEEILAARANELFMNTNFLPASEIKVIKISILRNLLKSWYPLFNKFIEEYSKFVNIK